MADILNQTSWIDKSVNIYVGELVEYDMREGGFSIIQKEKLLPPDVIKSFLKMSKEDRHKAVGNLAHSHNRKYKHVPKKLIEYFKEYRLMFGEKNDLKNDDIFYIRKDAICTKKYCYETKMDEYVEFREKNVYHSYMYLEPKYVDTGKLKPHPMEFYWSHDTGHVDVKGIKDSYVTLHENGLLNVVSMFMSYLYQLNYDGALRFIVSVMDAYKRGFGWKEGCEHPENYYRRFDSTGMYRVLQNGVVMEVEELGESMIPYCEKIYNYRNLLLPMLQLVIR